MPAGSIELYVPKKSRKRYTVTEDNSIENINQDYYARPLSMAVKDRYLKYFMDNNITLDNLYKYKDRSYTHKNNLDKNRYRDVYLSLPPEVRREFHSFFDLQCEVQGSTSRIRNKYRDVDIDS